VKQRFSVEILVGKFELCETVLNFIWCGNEFPHHFS